MVSEASEIRGGCVGPDGKGELAGPASRLRGGHGPSEVVALPEWSTQDGGDFGHSEILQSLDGDVHTEIAAHLDQGGNHTEGFDWPPPDVGEELAVQFDGIEWQGRQSFEAAVARAKIVFCTSHSSVWDSSTSRPSRPGSMVWRWSALLTRDPGMQALPVPGCYPPPRLVQHPGEDVIQFRFSEIGAAYVHLYI